MTDLLDPTLVATVLRVMTPLLLAALGILISDRAGVINIGMEGIMLAAALAAVLGSAWTGSPWVGLGVALITGALMGLGMAACVHGLGADVIIVGIALNLAAGSGTVLMLVLATGDKGMSGSLASGRLPAVPLPGAWLGGHHVLTWAAILAIPLTALLLRRTRLGLRIRAVGGDPAAARATGLSVARVQTQALALSGLFGAAAGAYLSLGYVTWFAAGMTAGRGFIALAAAVMGMGSTLGTALSALLLAAAETVAITLQAVGLPTELMQAIPYIVPAVVLTLWATLRGRLRR